MRAARRQAAHHVVHPPPCLFAGCVELRHNCTNSTDCCAQNVCEGGQCCSSLGASCYEASDCCAGGCGGRNSYGRCELHCWLHASFAGAGPVAACTPAPPLPPHTPPPPHPPHTLTHRPLLVSRAAAGHRHTRCCGPRLRAPCQPVHEQHRLVGVECGRRAPRGLRPPPLLLLHAGVRQPRAPSSPAKPALWPPMHSMRRPQLRWAVRQRRVRQQQLRQPGGRLQQPGRVLWEGGRVRRCEHDM
jgi:hypothetical protein